MSRPGDTPGTDVCGTTLFAREDRGATLSACGSYRYSLWRRWDYGMPSILFVMLNPSTADARDDDPTIRRCVGFAKRWGAGGIRVCNLYAWRATKPADLKKAPQNQIVSEWQRPHANDLAIRAAAGDAMMIVAAWGAWPGPFSLRPAALGRLLPEYRLHALGLTKEGAPRHPLYVRGDAEPIVFREAIHAR